MTRTGRLRNQTAVAYRPFSSWTVPDYDRRHSIWAERQNSNGPGSGSYIAERVTLWTHPVSWNLLPIP